MLKSIFSSHLSSHFSSSFKKKKTCLSQSVCFNLSSFLSEFSESFEKKIRRFFISNYFGTKNMIFRKKTPFLCGFWRFLRVKSPRFSLIFLEAGFFSPKPTYSLKIIKIGVATCRSLASVLNVLLKMTL